MAFLVYAGWCFCSILLWNAWAGHNDDTLIPIGCVSYIPRSSQSRKDNNMQLTSIWYEHDQTIIYVWRCHTTYWANETPLPCSDSIVKENQRDLSRGREVCPIYSMVVLEDRWDIPQSYKLSRQNTERPFTLRWQSSTPTNSRWAFFYTTETTISEAETYISVTTALHSASDEPWMTHQKPEAPSSQHRYSLPLVYDRSLYLRWRV